MVEWKCFLYSKQHSNEKISVVNLYYCTLNEWVERKDLKCHVFYNMYWETVWNRCNRKRNFFIYNFIIFNVIFSKPPNLIRVTTFFTKLWVTFKKPHWITNQLQTFVTNLKLNFSIFACFVCTFRWVVCDESIIDMHREQKEMRLHMRFFWDSTYNQTN